MSRPRRSFPYTNPAQARAAGVAVWTDLERGCAACGTARPVRYALDGSCQRCVQLDEVAAARGDPDACWSVIDAGRRGLRYHYDGEPCSRGPHLRLVDHGSGACLTCVHLASPRQRAKASGHEWYRPSVPCLRCGTMATRRVSDDACRACLREKDLADAAMRDHWPLTAQEMADRTAPEGLDRRVARALGFVYFVGSGCRRSHAGPVRRYCSTGACARCAGRA